MAISESRKRLALLTIAILCLAVFGWTVLKRRGPNPAGKAAELDVICASCGWEGRIAMRRGWRHCPQCGGETVHLAAACHTCGKVMPFLDDELYLRDSVAAMREHAREVLPVCPECGVMMMPKWVASPKVIRAGE